MQTKFFAPFFILSILLPISAGCAEAAMGLQLLSVPGTHAHRKVHARGFGRVLKAEDRLVIRELHKITASSAPGAGKDFISASALRGSLVTPARPARFRWSWSSLLGLFSAHADGKASVRAHNLWTGPTGVLLSRPGMLITCAALVCLLLAG